MYKWKPNATQRREFAERMKDPEEQKAYSERKYAKTHYNIDDSRSFANGSFVPTEMQYKIAINMLNQELSNEEFNAATQVSSAYICQDKTHHDYIHIVNHFEENKI